MRVEELLSEIRFGDSGGVGRANVELWERCLRAEDFESAGERVFEMEWNMCILPDFGLGREAGMRVEVEDMARVEERGERPKRRAELDLEIPTMGPVRMDGGGRSSNTAG